MKEKMLKIVLVLTGLLFVGLVIPGLLFARDPAVPMIMSLYVTMGIFLLLAAPQPSAHRSLIAFAGWANVAHASVMAVQEYLHVIQPKEMIGVILFGVVGVVLVALVPAKEATRLSAAGAA